jgi:hypothetical protein
VEYADGDSPPFQGRRKKRQSVESERIVAQANAASIN